MGADSPERPMLKTPSLAFIFAIALQSLGVTQALAQNYTFLAAPERDINLVYHLNRTTGEVGACQYGLKEGTVGVTLCYEPGEGAGPQTASDYSLVASNHEHEGGIFRVDLRNGEMSVCYLLKDKVVCTPPAK
jgi:hypothetical protein